MTQKTEINESVKPSHFAVRIVNNKTGEEKTNTEYANTTYYSTHNTSQTHDRFYNILKPLFVSLMKSMHIEDIVNDEHYNMELDKFLKSIDEKINTYKLHEINNIDNTLVIGNYTFIICDETFNIINDILLKSKILSDVSHCEDYLDAMIEVVTKYNEFSKFNYALNCDILNSVTAIKKIVEKHLL